MTRRRHLPAFTLLALATVAAVARYSAAAPSARERLAAATGEVRGLDLGAATLAELRELATIARERGVTLAWPAGLDDEAVVDRLDRSGLLAWVTSASVDCDPCVRRLARARHATRLRTLVVRGCAEDGFILDHHPCLWLGERAAAALARSRRLPALTELRITARGRALRSVLAGHLASSLGSLTVTTDAAGVAALGRAPRLTRLHTLVVDAPDNRAHAVATLVSSRHLRALRTLTFACADSEASQSLPRDGVAALARSMKLPALRALGVGDCYVGDEAIAALVAAPWLTQLAYLDLTHTGLTDGGGGQALAHLAARGRWPALRALALSEDARDHDSPWFRPLAAFQPVLVQRDAWLQGLPR